jgi:hypothetical protein
MLQETVWTPLALPQSQGSDVTRRKHGVLGVSNVTLALVLER